jgi:type II secretory pathway predicted ATPase ExeA
MHDLARGLVADPFGADFDAKFFYRGFQHASALSFLDRALDSGEAVVALTGAKGSGRRSAIDYFVREDAGRFRSARLESLPTEGHAFLEAVLEAFGFGPVEAERAELRNLLSVFLVQVQHVGQALLLHIHEPADISDEVQEEILWLTREQSRENSLKVVLTGAEELNRLLDSQRLAALAAHLRLRHRIDPLSARETHDYLHFRLAAAGCGQPAEFFSSTMATAIYAATGGIPGRINQLASGVLKGSAGPDAQPLDVDLVRDVASKMGLAGVDAIGLDARLVISLEGETFLEVPVAREKLLIGRHSFNDICLRDHSVSRHHAIIVPNGPIWVIVDLNSTNGILVNGKKVRQQVLTNGDEITVGRFDLVFQGGPSGEPAQPPDDSDMRRTIVLTENVKTIS